MLGSIPFRERELIIKDGMALWRNRDFTGREIGQAYRKTPVKLLDSDTGEIQSSFSGQFLLSPNDDCNKIGIVRFAFAE
jgi:hypothetical protein